MRYLPTLMLSLMALAVSAMPGVTGAQSQSPSGNFASSFEIVVDNCRGVGGSMNKGAVAVVQSGPILLVKIKGLPDMTGKPAKRGKLRAQGKRDSGESGLRTKYGFSGRVRGSKLQAVLVAEFFKGDKPQCTQSWSVTGTRSGK